MRRLWLVVLLLGCGGAAQKRRTFEVDLASTAVGQAPNDKGWAVTLSSAEAVVGPIRFFEGKAAFARRGPRFDPWSLVVSTAWAHPGHYVAGEARAELLVSTKVDLLKNGPLLLGTADAVTGEYGSFQLTLKDVRLKGSATKEGRTVQFDTGAFSPAAPLDGLKFEAELQDQPGTAHLRVKLAVLFARIDFDKGAGSPATEFPPASEAFNAFTRGVLDASAYEMEFSP